ncbi:hypothetical protein ACEUB7_10405 [Aeromonas veronii]
MPLTKDNFENFYRGNCAENIVASQIFFHGFEAHKFNPDFGVDLLATNKARQLFLGEASKEISIQVKSSLVVKERALISIDKIEFDDLMKQNNPVLILVIFEPEFIGNPSHHFYLDPYSQTLHSIDEALENSFAEHKYNSQFNISKSIDRDAFLKNKKAAENLDLDGYKSSLYWLNKNHLNKALDLGVLKEGKGDSKFNYCLELAKNDNGLWHFISSNKSEHYPYPEISHLSYLLLKNKFYGLEMEDFALSL